MCDCLKVKKQAGRIERTLLYSLLNYYSSLPDEIVRVKSGTKKGAGQFVESIIKQTVKCHGGLTLPILAKTRLHIIHLRTQRFQTIYDIWRTN